jgi:hypothetical protein
MANENGFARAGGDLLMAINSALMALERGEQPRRLISSPDLVGPKQRLSLPLRLMLSLLYAPLGAPSLPPLTKRPHPLLRA